MNDLSLDTPVLTASNLLAERWRRGSSPGIPPPETALVCYQPSALRSLRRKHALKRVPGFFGEVWLVKGSSGRVIVTGNFGIGAPAAVLQLEELAAFGLRRVISVGLAGSLQQEAQSGDWLVGTGAGRGEGTSGHYLPASLRIDADGDLIAAMTSSLAAWGVPLHSGPVWTTDTPLRETRRDVESWQREGICAVEMEAAALFTAGKALGIRCGAAFTLADRVFPDRWEPPTDPRLVYRRLELLAEAVLHFLVHEEGSG